MQVYQYMDIGSAKITKEEMQGIPHHLVDVLPPTEEFNVVRFQQMAKEAIAQIIDRGHIPIIVGGTGFYIQALLYDIDFIKEESAKEVREKYEQLVKEHGAEYLHQLLEKVDPQSAHDIHANNIKRVVRALEYYDLTGKKISEHNKEQREKQSAYRSCYFVLNDDRARLYERIDKRVDLMMEQGLLDEVRMLRQMGCDQSLVSMQGLGYKEILCFLDGECTLEEAVYRIKRDTRHFAKRQLTWFKRERDVIWLDKPAFGYDEEKILDAMGIYLKEKEILC
jgi:tRNA dimethylallyltransferase